MEYNSDSSSDKDRKMQNKFESFDTDDDDDESIDKKKKKSSSLADIIEEQKPEKRGSIFDDLKNDKKEKDQAPPEKLTSDEEKTVVGEIAKARSKDLEQELSSAEPDTAHEAEILADAAFMEAVAEKMADGASIEEVLDDSEAEILEVLEIEPDEIEETEPGLEDSPTEDEPNEYEEDESDPGASTPVASRTIPPVVPPVVPPIPPHPPVPPPPIPPLPGSGPGPGPNIMAPTPNIAPSLPSYESHIERSRAGDLLLGGIVGYLIGRRRGRIRTEAKLMPVQKKLEGEVKDLQEKIALREKKIRNLVTNQITSQPEVGQPKIIERLTERIEKRAEARAEKDGESFDQEIEGRHSSEVHQDRTERIGRMVLPKAEALTPHETKSVENLTTAELLEVAERIQVEGVSVKEMYRAGRLDAVGLRRVVREFLAGRNYERLLSDNLNAGLSPERLRDQPGGASMTDQGGLQAGGAAAIASQGFESPRSSAPLTQAGLPEPAGHLITLGQREARQKRTAITALIVVIASALALFLLFS